MTEPKENQKKAQKKRKEYRQKAALLRRFLRGSKRFFLLAIVLTGVTTLADMLIPQIVRVTVDNVIGARPASFPAFADRIVEKIGGMDWLRENLWVMALLVVLAALMKVVSQYAFRVCNTKASETLVKTTRDSVFEQALRLPYAWHTKNHTGDIIQRCTSDIETMQGFVSGEMTSLFRIVILLLFSTVFMVRMHLPLALLALLPMPFLIVNSMLFDRKIEAGFEKFDEEEGRLSSVVQENLTGVRVVRAFGRESRERDVFHRQNAKYTELGRHVDRDMGLFWAGADILTGLQSLLVMACGAYFCVKGSMTAGEWIAFMSYNGLLAWPMNDLGEIITELGKAGISMDRIRYIMEAEPEEDTGKEKPPLTGDIVFDRVQFSYENNVPLLRDVSFTIRAGTTVGILGGTGAGKSTLMFLLDKLYSLPEGCGRITIGGTDIRDIDTAWLRKQIGIVLQDPYLFSGTIAENISCMDAAMDRDMVRQAAADACLDEAVTAFSKGYETVVGERGVTLSGGQKQRTAIARVLTQDVPILIFDDSMSAVDTETDARIRASLEKKFGQATVILISHRMTTLSRADQILVLENGRIAEQGTPDELLQAGGLYKKIYDMQTGLREEEQT